MTENEEARFAIIRQLNELETRINRVASDQTEIARAVETSAKASLELALACTEMLARIRVLEESPCLTV